MPLDSHRENNSSARMGIELHHFQGSAGDTLYRTFMQFATTLCNTGLFVMYIKII